MQIEIRGRAFDTVAAAANAHGVHPNAVYIARRKGTLHRVGTGRVGAEPLPVRIGGVDYTSAEAAAKALNVARAAIYSAIEDGDPDRVLRAPRYNPSRCIPLTIGNLTFPSRRAASRALGFSNDEFVQKAIASGSRKSWERVLAAAMRLEAQQAKTEREGR